MSIPDRNDLSVHYFIQVGRLANEAKRLHDSAIWVGKGSEANIESQLQSLEA